MTYEVILTARARQDLREITAWYVQRSGRQDVADRWVDGFFDTLENLRTNPTRCPLVREVASLDMDVREIHYGSGRKKTHRILYEVIGECVFIMRIRHSAQRDITRDDL
jgi:plasmid stabilization system protein ParE